MKNGLTNVHLQLEKEFESLIRGKSVAILGRGPSLEQCDGEIIESHDVIVRVHRPAPIDLWWPPPLVQKEWQAKVGTRTEILYTSFGFTSATNPTIQKDFIDRVVNSFRNEGGKLLCRPEPIYAISPEVRPASKFIEQKMSLRYLSYSLYEQLRDVCNSVPYPGTCVVADVLAYEPSNIFIGGMTCYLDASPVGIVEGSHVSKADFNFIRNVWRSNPVDVQVDPLMEELFRTIDESIPTEAPTAGDLYQTSADGSVNTYISKK